MRVVFVGRDRVVWKRLLWSVLTLGVSRRVWLHRITREIDGHQALGLDHRRTAAMLWSAALCPLLLAIGSASGWPAPALLLTTAFLVPTTVLTYQTAQRTDVMLSGSGIRYGRPRAVWAATLVPVVGPLWFIFWQQSRLNRFWAEERKHPEHGVEVDVPLEDDPRFIVELAQAQRESYFAASRFERRKVLRPALERRRQALADIRAERLRVRELGGSTPVLPWRRPRPPPTRLLDVTCTTCQHRFQQRQDPLQETVLVCPSCGRTDVLPALGQDALRREVRPVRHAKVTCPSCAKVFHTLRPDEGEELKCPHCGHAEPFLSRRSAALAAKAKAKPAK